MKVAVVLIVAMVMMLGQESDGCPRRSPPPSPYAWYRRHYHVHLPYRFGKRQAGDPEFEAKYNAACEDGVLTEEEIKSVFGVDDVTAFIATYDMNEDGVVTCQEYEEAPESPPV